MAAAGSGGPGEPDRELEVGFARQQVIEADPAPWWARRRTLDVLDHPEHPLARNSYSVGHLTASALVIDPEGPRMVLLHHRKLDIWVQPGGHVDLSGDLAADALREATEETGIEGLSVVRPAVDIDVHPIVTPAEPPHDHHDVRFVVLAPGGAELVPNHESKAARWVDMDHFGGLDVDDSVRRLADAGRRWLSGRP